jgi:replication-associated recombination protein RarA
VDNTNTKGLDRMNMIPKTIHGMSPHECISAMQKFIRRGMEREAMEMAVEMGHTSKAFATWITNRLEIISHEDIGLACPNVITLVFTSCRQARDWYDPRKLGQWRMAVGTAIRAMCRAPKSREGDHFQAAIGLRSQLEDYTPEVPDWVCDGHTNRGKSLGRGVEYFREVSTKLVPAQDGEDEYEEEAFRLWELKKVGAKPTAETKGKGTVRTTKELF